MERVVIFDTTLRDGEQCPGAAMGLEDKLRIARQLERMRVDVIEAGFPAASPGDFEAVRAIAREVRGSAVCALARARREDIERAGEALAQAESGRIHTFIATSRIHMEKKLRMSPDAVLERIPEAIGWARGLCGDVEFSAEDAARSDFDFLRRAIEAAIRAGARTVNIPDTVGYAMPWEYAELIRRLREGIPDSDRAVFSAHCHDDLGQAAANSIAAAALGGARQIECSINGLGERAGNAPLEEVVMALRARGELLGLETGVDAGGIAEASRLVALATGFAIAPNKAIVGKNAFAHASGIHQDGMLKERATYEILRAEDVGRREEGLALGKHSGRAALRERLRGLGLEPESEGELNALFARFKELADAKGEIGDEDLRALRLGDSAQARDRFAVASVWASLETGERARARVALRVGGEERSGEGEGVGAVDALFRALGAASGAEARVARYSVESITGGSDAQAEVTVRLERGGSEANGRGADPDIVLASAKAWASALSRLEREAGAGAGDPGP